MEEKINLRLICIAFIALVLTALSTSYIYYQAFEELIYNNLKADAAIITKAYSHLDSYDNLLDFNSDKLRITLIAPDGTVLFESNTTQTMENHLDRPEVLAALSTGSGEATRKSDTLGYNTHYYALKLEDGNILRLAIDANDPGVMFGKALPAIEISALIIFGLSIFMSVLLSKKLVSSFTHMISHLDEYDPAKGYKEFKPIADAIKTQRSDLIQAQNMRQEFTANVSHELKTPLTSISGYAEMIENGMVQDKDIRDFAAKIHHEAGRLITLIGDIIKLSELDANDSAEESAPVDLLELAKNVEAILAFSAEKHHVSLSVSGDSAYVLGEKHLLEELIYNLCDNAIRYNKENGEVHIGIKAQSDQVLLTVADSGIGIAEEHQPRIFERFYRVDKSHSKMTGGTGLGLAIVKHIVLHHHAEISLKSTVGKGTEITVVFQKANPA